MIVKSQSRHSGKKETSNASKARYSLKYIQIPPFISFHCRIRIYSGPYFPAFKLNTKRYSVRILIQSKYGKILTRLTPNMDTFYGEVFMEYSLGGRPSVSYGTYESKYVSDKQMISYFCVDVSPTSNQVLLWAIKLFTFHWKHEKNSGHFSLWHWWIPYHSAGQK